jgi:hypothetical protein
MPSVCFSIFVSGDVRGRRSEGGPEYSEWSVIPISSMQDAFTYQVSQSFVSNIKHLQPVQYRKLWLLIKIRTDHS